MPVIKLPDFDFSGMYYPELLEALLEYKRRNIPEISNENPFEVGVQMLRAFALIGHLNNTLLDITALETMLSTAQLRPNVVRLLALLGFNPHGNVPATVVLRAELTRAYTTSTLLVPDNAVFGTRRRSDREVVLFEADGAVTVSPTDLLTEAWLLDELGNWTDYTAVANGVGVANLGAVALRALYLGHDSVFPDTIEFSGVEGFDPGDDTAADPVAIHLQYYDGDLEDGAPDAVTVQPSNLRFDLDTLTGPLTKEGSYVNVTVNATGVTERCAVQFDGVNFVETTGFLNQTTVSTVVSDYTVGSYWHDVDVATDDTADTAAQTDTYATASGAISTWTVTLGRAPLEPDTIVSWTYFSGAVPKTATYDLATGTLGGDAGPGTTVNATTGASTLVALSLPDAGDVFALYTRKTATLRQSGKITWLPPFNSTDWWVKGALPDELRGSTGPSTEAYWFRILFSGFGSNTLGDFTFDGIAWDSGRTFIQIPATQGSTVAEVAGSGTGAASQAFVLGESPVIEGSVVLTIDGEEWTQVEDFFASSSVDQHYTVAIDSDGVATVTVGDGSNGHAVPTGTNNVDVSYRVGGAEDGNVGAGQIEVSRTGLSRVRNITNPRAASGWIAQEGTGALGLERLKRDGVASLRTLHRAVSVHDVQYLATRWEVNGAYPFTRARAVENGYGLKTIKLILVPTGVDTSSPTLRAELDAYFNGDINEGGVEEGVLVANQEVTSVDYTPKSVDVTVTVDGGSEAAIRAALLGQLQPLAQRDDTSWRWSFGQTVTLANLIGIITNADRDVRDVTLTVPAASVTLADDELPVLGTLDLTVNE